MDMDTGTVLEFVSQPENTLLLQHDLFIPPHSRASLSENHQYIVRCIDFEALPFSMGTYVDREITLGDNSATAYFGMHWAKEIKPLLFPIHDLAT